MSALGQKRTFRNENLSRDRHQNARSRVGWLGGNCLKGNRSPRLRKCAVLKYPMSSSENDRAPPKVWSLEHAALWIETRASVPRQPIHCRIAPTTVQELHQVLKAGTITASGCVDGGERRAISPEEWNDYRLRLKHTAFAGHHYTGTSGTPVIAVLSIRSFPAAVLKYHGYPSRVRVPSAHPSDSEPAYHRVITDVRARETRYQQKDQQIARLAAIIAEQP
jgi:hypothetical protein